MADQFKSCSVSGCKRNAHSSARGKAGLCSAHYQRRRKYGDPVAGRSTYNGEPENFYRDVVLPYDGDDCLFWPFARNSNGYAKSSFGEIHHLVCEQDNGPPPTDKHQAAHSCGKGNLGCVARKHLSWKTSKQNAADAIEHGTNRRGVQNPVAKLSEDDVRAILSLRDEMSQGEIAARFGVKQPQISSIFSGRYWSWISKEKQHE